MNFDVVVTCAVTGAGDTTGKSPHVPVTPAEIAREAIEAAKAGASCAHIHVRDPVTGKGSRDPALFREVVDRVRASGTDIVINLTAGMGGDWTPDPNNWAMPGPGTDMVGPDERLAHVKDCLPELEVFELGHIRFARAMMDEGLLADPPMFQLCLGIPWGADQTVETMKAMKEHLPPNASWASFGISRMQMPMAAAAVALGGNVRVGLEDNLFLDRGVLATNAQLVERVIGIVTRMGARVLTPQQARNKLKLRGADV